MIEVPAGRIIINHYLAHLAARTESADPGLRDDFLVHSLLSAVESLFFFLFSF